MDVAQPGLGRDGGQQLRHVAVEVQLDAVRADVKVPDPPHAREVGGGEGAVDVDLDTPHLLAAQRGDLLDGDQVAVPDDADAVGDALNLRQRVAGEEDGAAVVDDLLDRNTLTRGSRVTRLELRRDRLVVIFGPVIEGVAVTVDKTVDIGDLFRDWTAGLT